MRLRNFITRPARLDEKDSSSLGVPSLSSRAKRVVQPEYPSLLKSAVVKSSPIPSPATFPSRSLAPAPLKAYEEQVQSPDELLQDDIHDSEERVSSSPQDDGPKTNVRSEDNHFNLDESIGDMHTSPLRNDALLVVSPVEWSMLDKGLQLYIFDSLRSQHKHSEIVARMLGLGTSDLRNLLFLRTLRATHPLHTNQLWQHCLSLSEGNPHFVDPKILDHYMAYFTFAESFETASTYQRQLAKSFLSQHDIVGPWVDALLRGESGIWNRPRGPNPTSEHPEIGFDGGHPCSTSFDEVWWCTALQDVRFHESHDLGRLAAHVKSPYFPASVRDELLGKATSELSSLESWLIYAQSDSELNELQPPIEASPTDALKPPSIQLQPTLQLLGSLIKENAYRFDLYQETMGHQIPSLYMYTITRFLAQMRLMKKEVDSTPFTREEKLRMLEAAKAQCISKLLRDVEGRIPHASSPKPQLRSSSQASIESSTLVDDEAMQTTIGRDSEPETMPTSPIELSQQPIGLAMNSEPQSQDSNNSLRMDVELPRPGNKRRSDQLTMNATLPMPKSVQYRPKLVACSVQTGLEDVAGLWPDRHRSPSIEPYHTPPGQDEDVAMTTPTRRSRQTGRKSPTPPPWSPISEVDVASRSLDHATTVHQKQEDSRTVLSSQIGFILPRNTSWLSTKAARKKPLTLSNFQPSRLPSVKELAPEGSSTSVIREPVTFPDGQQSAGQIAIPENSHVGTIPNSLITLTNEQTADRRRPATSKVAKVSVTTPSLPSGGEQHAEPVHQSQHFDSHTLLYPARSKTPTKQKSFPTFGVQPTPASRPVVPAGSTARKTKKARERTIKPSEDQPRPIASGKTPKLREKLLLREEVQRPKSPRKDKGQKRGIYMTKKRRAEAAGAEAEAEVAKRVNDGGDQAARTPSREGQ